MIYTRIHCVYTTLAGSGAAGSADGFGAAVRFYYPCGVAVAGDGHFIVTDDGPSSD